MRKIILCVVLLTGYVAFANASVKINAETVSAVQVTDGDYKEVALADLSEVVQEAVKNLAGEVYDIVKVEINTEKELTKVTLRKKEIDETETVTLDKEGKKVTE